MDIAVVKRQQLKKMPVFALMCPQVMPPYVRGCKQEGCKLKYVRLSVGDLPLELASFPDICVRFSPAFVDVSWRSWMAVKRHTCPRNEEGGVKWLSVLGRWVRNVRSSERLSEGSLPKPTRWIGTRSRVSGTSNCFTACVTLAEWSRRWKDLDDIRSYKAFISRESGHAMAPRSCACTERYPRAIIFPHKPCGTPYNSLLLYLYIF